MRQQLTTLEKVLKHCNSLKTICSAAESHHGLQEEFKDSLHPAKVLLSALLKLKVKSLNVFSPATYVQKMMSFLVY